MGEVNGMDTLIRPRLTATDVTREMYFILRDAHIEDGKRGFNRKTYTGRLEAKTEEDALDMIREINTLRGMDKMVYDIELEIACMLDDIDEINEDDLLRLQGMVAKLAGVIGYGS